MKKFFVFLIAVLLVFSINGYSQDKTKRTPQSSKIEQARKGNVKAGIKPKKSKSKRKMQRPKLKPRSHKKTGNELKL